MPHVKTRRGGRPPAPINPCPYPPVQASQPSPIDLSLYQAQAEAEVELIMGLLAHLPFMHVLVLGFSVSGFALAANKNHYAHALYEDYLKDPLETSEVAFIAAKDWTKIFFDCFTTIILWFDALYSAIVLLFFLLFVDDIAENFGRIVIEFTGLALQLASVFGYVMLKSAHDDKFDPAEAKKENTRALIFFKSFGFVTLLQLQGKLIVPESYWGIALCLSIGGMIFQCLILFSSLFYRVKATLMTMKQT